MSITKKRKPEKLGLEQRLIANRAANLKQEIREYIET
jgi:hypothetical protein